MKNIKTNVVFVHRDQPMVEVVALMKDKNISCVLVHDDNDLIVGVLTERDVVQKFTLINLEDKLERSVGTVMTKPVKFAHSDTLITDIKDLYVNYGVRHFPVSTSMDENGLVNKDNVLGIVTSTDLIQSLLLENQQNIKFLSESEIRLSLEKKVTYLTNNMSQGDHYCKVLRKMGFATQVYKLSAPEDAWFKSSQENHATIIVDIENSIPTEFASILVLLKHYNEPVFVFCKQVDLLSKLKIYVESDNYEVFLKPINFGYINWKVSNHLLNRKT